MGDSGPPGRSTLTRRTPPPAATPTTTSTSAPKMVVNDDDDNLTPITIRRPLLKRKKSGPPESDDDGPQLACELLEMRKLLTSCDLNVRMLLRENAIIKKELTDVKKILTTYAATNPPMPTVSAPTQPNPAVPLFSSVVKNTKAVIINPSSPKDVTITKQMLHKKLDPSKFALSTVKPTKMGGVVIECSNSAERDRLITAAKIGDTFEVSKPTSRLPRIRLIGLSKLYTAPQLTSMLRSQNQSILSEHTTCNVVHTFEIRTSSVFGAILEVELATFNKMIEAKHLYAGFDSCAVYEDVNVRRCYKCWGFNHVSAKCTSATQRCSNCAGDHHYKDCTSADPKCAACEEAVKTMHMTLDIYHAATSVDCPTYKHRVETARRSCGYTK